MRPAPAEPPQGRKAARVCGCSGRWFESDKRLEQKEPSSIKLEGFFYFRILGRIFRVPKSVYFPIDPRNPLFLRFCLKKETPEIR